METKEIRTQHPQPTLAYAAAILALIALGIAILADVVAGFIVQDYSSIRETISDLAAGQRSWILDYGLQIGAIGIMVLAVALRQWKLDTLRWEVGTLGLLLLGVDIIVIARRNVYGDNDPSGTPIHIYLVLVLGILFPLVCWLLAKGLGHLDKRWEQFSKGVAVVWLLFAPIFFIVPDAWDGAYERGIAGILLTWLGFMCFMLLRYCKSDPAVSGNK